MGILLSFPSHSSKKYVYSSGGPRKILAFDISPVGKLTYRFDCGGRGRLSAPWASMASNRFVTVSVTVTLIQKEKGSGKEEGEETEKIGSTLSQCILPSFNFDFGVFFSTTQLLFFCPNLKVMRGCVGQEKFPS